MLFDPENNIVKLCAEGMTLEGSGEPGKAAMVFTKAWNEASNDFEKFIAAHYIARHQKSTTDKLTWDKTALGFALQIQNDSIKEAYPSLYLNIAKCYEDLNDLENARINYQAALSFIDFLPNDNYGNMIKGGIMNGIERGKQ